MKKTYLLTPGPTPIPENILALQAKQIIHHRTPKFMEIMKQVQKGLKTLFQTKNDVMLLTSSGTGGMEAAVTNIFSKGDKVITVNCGKFGERWTKIAKAHGLNAVEIKVEAGSAVTLKQVQDTVAANPDARAVLFQASETSTGTANPVREICEFLKTKPNMISVVDGITALGVMDLQMDNWGIDVLITGSQKALMLAPGLACISLSDRAWAMNAKSDLPKFYFDLAKERKSLEKGQTAWTPAISLITGLEESLKMINEETLPKLFERHAKLAAATRAAVKAMGLELFSTSPSDAVTAVKVPKEIADGKAIPKRMRDLYSVTITGGQDELEGKIFRLTHFGHVDRFDITTGISALELALHDLGYKKFALGTGVGAALKYFSEHYPPN